MDISCTSSTLLLPEDLRSAYKQILKDEINTRDPAQGVKLMSGIEGLSKQFSVTLLKKPIS